MNYWPRWVNAITNATAHLSLAEMGAYDRLLDHYYKTEQPLPADVDTCCRIVRASTPAERRAVQAILSQFFVLTDTGHINGRADEEIARALPQIEAARANGKKGGRPKGSGKGSSEKPIGFPTGTQDEPGAKAPHPHISPSLRSGDTARKRATPRPDDVSQQTWDDWCQLRKVKRATVSDTVIAEARVEANKAGISLERFLAIWCIRGSQGLQADWLRSEERGRPTESFRERDERAATARVHALTGGLVAAKPNREVIDVTARSLDRPDLLEDGPDLRLGMAAHVGRR